MPAAPTRADGQRALQRGAFAEAESILARVVETNPQDGLAWQLHGYALHAQGKLREALVSHGKAAGFPVSASHGTYNSACAHALLGELELAFQWLDRALIAGFSDLDLLAKDADLESLHSDPRWPKYAPPGRDPAQPFVEPVVILHDLRGEAAQDQFGWVARAVGDCDGDGITDYASTAPFHSTGAAQRGAAYVHSGRSGALLFAIRGDAGEQLGWSVAGAGDVDRDGRADVIVGAPGTAAMPGSAYVHSGADGTRLLALRGAQPGAQFGREVGSAGDVDRDGAGDLLVGEPRAGKELANAGAVHVFSGASGGSIAVRPGAEAGAEFGGGGVGSYAHDGRVVHFASALLGGADRRGRLHVWDAVDGHELRVLAGDEHSREFGSFLSAVGDCDKDGVVDVLANDWKDESHGPVTGRTWVFSGRDGRRLHSIAGERAGEGFGIGVCNAGDLDGDGHADLVIGAWRSSEAARLGGCIRIFSGADGTRIGSITGKLPGDVLGFDAAGVGDVDGDGTPDLLVTSAYSSLRGPKSGRTYVLSGRSCLAK